MFWTRHTSHKIYYSSYTKHTWKSVRYSVPHSQTSGAMVTPGKKEEKEPLPWGRLVSGAEVGVDLQSKQQQPETHEENWKDQLVP